MQLSLVPFTGDGRDHPFRPEGAPPDTPWSCIDLRPDSSRVDGYALLWSDSTRGYKVAEHRLDTLPQIVVAGVEDHLRLDIKASTMAELLRELMIRPHGKWKPVQPQWILENGVLHGEKRVCLGGEVWHSERQAKGYKPGLDPTDDFQRPDESPIQLPWVNNTYDPRFPLNFIEIRGGNFAQPTSAGQQAYYSGACATPDHYSEITVGVGSDQVYFGPAVRIPQNPQHVYPCGYVVQTNWGGSWSLVKDPAISVSAAKTVIASGFGADIPKDNDVIRLSVTGSTLTVAFKGADEGQWTDTEIDGTNSQPGIALLKKETLIGLWQGADILPPHPEADVSFALGGMAFSATVQDQGVAGWIGATPAGIAFGATGGGSIQSNVALTLGSLGFGATAGAGKAGNAFFALGKIKFNSNAMLILYTNASQTEVANDVYVCNLALGRLGEYQLMSLKERTVPARNCDRFYVSTVDEVLREHQWNFATGHAKLSEVKVNPGEFEWLHAYQLPEDFVRLRKLNRWMPEDEHAHWEIERDMVLTDDDVAEIKYTRQITNVALWDPMAIEALSLKLAYKIAVPITGSITLAQQLFSEYQQIVMPRAQRVDASEAKQRDNPAWANSALVRSRGI